MAVFKHSYRAYSGPLTSHWRRLLVLVRYGFSGIWSSRVTLILMVISCVPTLAGIGVIYLANNPSARLLLGALRGVNVTIDQSFFLAPFQTQCWIALALAAWIAPRLVCPDLTDNALPTILSRPITRADYVIGKFIVVASTLSLTTWIPLLLMFAFQVYSSPEPWAGQHAYLAFAIVAGACLWITVLGMVAIALSAWVKWRIVATGLVFASIFVPAGMGNIANLVLRTRWGYLISVPDMMSILWKRLFRIESLWREVHSIPTTAVLVALFLIAMGSIAALNMRIRAREVVRG